MKQPATLDKKGSPGPTTRQPNWQRIILLTVLGYEAAGGMLGGVLLAVAPDGRLMSIPVDVMHGAFRDFFIPGIILLGLGVLNAFAFRSVLRRSPADWLMAGLALGGYLIWFIVEIVILRELHWLHLMWGMPVLLAWLVLIPLIALRNPAVTTQRVLLSCGILSSAWYFAINIYVPMQYDDYSLFSLTVSELSAIGAPTRQLWVLLAIPYPLAFAAFGWGVLQSVRHNRPLRIVGWLIIAYCAVNLYWPPMHMRGMEPTLTDALHITWASAAVLLMMTLMALGAAAFVGRFRIYTIMSIALHIFFGVLTSLEAPGIPTDGFTPWIGLWERINIGIFMLWVVALAAVLLRNERVRAGDQAKQLNLTLT